MITPADVMNVPTREQKEQAAAARMKTHLRHMIEAANLGLKDVANFMRIEVDGGKCPKCEKAWKEIVYDNKFGMGRYFEPVCRCYPTCNCGPAWNPIRHLYREWAADQLVKIVPKGKYLSHGKIIEIPRSKVMQCPGCDSIMDVIEHLTELKPESGTKKSKKK